MTVAGSTPTPDEPPTLVPPCMKLHFRWKHSRCVTAAQQTLDCGSVTESERTVNRLGQAFTQDYLSMTEYDSR